MNQKPFQPSSHAQPTRRNPFIINDDITHILHITQNIIKTVGDDNLCKNEPKIP